MNRALAPLLVLAMLPGASPLEAQSAKGPRDVFLYGRVILKDHAPAYESDNYYLQVSVQYENSKKALPVRNASWDLYSCRVKPGSARIRLHFTASYYQTQNTRYFSVKNLDDIPMHPPVELSRIVPKNGHASTGDLLGELKQEAALADVTSAYDVFQWNLAALRYTYRNKPDFLKALQQFQADARSQPWSALRYAKRQDLYFNIIARDNGETIAIDQKNLLALVKAEDAFPGIRASAIQALSTGGALEPAVNEEFLPFLRKQTMQSSALLLRPAQTALARIGTQRDKDAIIRELSNPADPERTLASVIAIGKSGLHSGREGLQKLANAVDKDSEIWLAVQSALRQLSRIPASAGQPTYVWKDGAVNPDFTLQMQASSTDTATTSYIPEKVVSDPQKGMVLRMDYPEGRDWGLLQFLASQTGATFQPRDLSGYTHLVLQLKSDKPNTPIKVGLKADFDPDESIVFEEPLTIQTEWAEYSIDLRRDPDGKQLTRLKRLKAVVQLALSGKEKQTLYVGEIYFRKQ